MYDPADGVWLAGQQHSAERLVGTDHIPTKMDDVWEGQISDSGCRAGKHPFMQQLGWSLSVFYGGASVGGAFLPHPSNMKETFRSSKLSSTYSSPVQALPVAG